MSAYTMKVVGEFNSTVDYKLLNLQIPPLNHCQSIEDVIALTDGKKCNEMAIIFLCSDKVLREILQGIGKKINKGRKGWDKVPIVVANPKNRYWQEKVVGFMADVWIFSEKGISEEQTSWITELYGTRNKL